MSKILYAGVARRIINPMIGIRKAGLRLFGDPIQAIESDLTATVLVLSDGDTRVVIIGTDLITMTPDEAGELRAGVAQALGISNLDVMLNLSHNHSAPALPQYMSDSPEQIRLKERYKGNLKRWLIEAATEANQNIQPARIGTGWGECQIGVYRRESRDERDVLGEVLDHAIDSSVGVIRVDDLDGNPIATIFRYSCHPVTVGPRSFIGSSDFPGPAREVIEKSLGGLAIFMQGCGGNINPLVGIGYEVDCRDTKNRVGMTLGSEALKVAVNIRTNRKPGKRIPLGNVPNILFTPWEPIDGDTCTHLSASELIVPVEFIDLPPLKEAEAIHDRWLQTLEDRRQRGAQEWEIRVAEKYEQWARELVDAVRHGPPPCELYIQALRVNDIVIVGINAEVFFETGLTIKALSPFKDTFILGYTNGLIFYLPRADDYPLGGWKIDANYAVPDLMFQAYFLPVAIQPTTEQTLVQRAVDLIQQSTIEKS